ncbi:C-C motif chemokine 3 precursor-like [Scleropages formosus]|uniref:C-C motif chemokine 3-like n=1 Tax=Scleropages formosus TaxID=113540 RepID=A0A0P7X8I7_SCLFO|nr:eotaxin-like [Scleropages formosus]KPP72967.1 C-C motif chemokine 3 precursor-like [Scleropages formosus]
MRLPTVAAALACLVALVARACAASGPTLSCCLSVSDTVVPRRRVSDYRVQNAALCPVRTVVFLTTSGKTVCSDPEKKWVKRAIRWVNNKRAKMGGSLQTTGRPKTNREKPRNKGKKRMRQRKQKTN